MDTALGFITDETLDAVKKAQTSGVTSTTGLVGFDLSGVVSLVPVNTPFFNRIKTEQGDGSAAANWKALLNVNGSQPNPFTGFDAGGALVQLSEQDVVAPYRPVRVSGKVTRDSIALAKGYADAKAIASTNTLMQWRIQDNKALLGGQNFALPTIGTVSLSTSTTGGTIGNAVSVAVRCAARSAYNYYWGGSGIASTNQSITTGAGTTNSVTATVPAVKGAVAYDWFVAGFYVTTTEVNRLVVTSVPGANSTTVPALPGLSTTLPTAVPGADTSFSANSYNGLIASLAGDYNTATGVQVTPGTGASSGATFTSLDGGTLTGSSQGISQIDNLLLTIYNLAQLSPTMMLMNAQQANDTALKVLGTTFATTFLDPNPAASRTGLTAGASVARYINRASGGDPIEIVVDPWMPVGTIVFGTERVPYPNSNIANTFGRRVLQDVTQFDYGTSLTVGANGGPRDEWDQSSIETFVNRAPVTCGVLSNIAAG